MPENKASVLNLGATHGKTVLKLSFPTIVEQMVFSLFTMVDTAMVGALGGSASAAVGILSPFCWLLGGSIVALTTGFSVITAYSIGESNMEKANRSVNKGLWASFAVGSAIALICFLLSGKIPVWLGAEPDVAAMSAVYMAIYSLTFLVNIVGTAASSTLRSCGETKLPLAINSVSVAVNVVLNVLFIFPTRKVSILGYTFTMWGAGKGVGGAGAATFASVLVSTVLLITALCRNSKGISVSMKRILERGDTVKSIYRRAYAIGMPVFLERLIINLGQLIYMRCISTMGTSAVAIHHLAVQAESFSYMPISGIQAAVQTLMSQSIGAREYESGERFAKISAKAGFIYGTFAGLVLFLLGRPIMSLFTPDASLVKQGAYLLKIVAFGEAVQALNIVYSGCLRGIRETKAPFYIGLTGIWIIRILLCVISTFVFNMGIRAAWVIMVIDMCYRGIATTLCFRKKYDKIKARAAAAK